MREAQQTAGTTGLGRKGEERAALTLEAAGLGIIARNVRSPRGEVDIVAMDGETLVFVEVKAWSAYGIENLRYGLNSGKQRRIIETAKYFLSSHRKYNGKAVRFDVVFIGKEAVTHLASAFMERV
ncbi:MAG: YraN family protein [Treponema sp.]|jgi:putative endonuclease|nr:YraN family protein [Treponema sp.]